MELETLQTYPCFKDLVNKSEIHRELRLYGKKVVPLSLVGTFLNFAGNHMLEWVYKQYKVKPFHPGHRVVSIQLLTKGDIIVTTVRKVQLSARKKESLTFQEVE